MLFLKIENEYGESYDFSKSADYAVTVTGLTPGSATLKTSKVASKHGCKCNGSTLNERNIVLNIYPRNNVEQNRIDIYKYIVLGGYIKLYLKNGTRDTWIEGHIETIEGDLFTAPQMLQVSIICGDPFFKDVNSVTTEFTSVTTTFEFPMNVTSEGVIFGEIQKNALKNVRNESNSEIGVIIDIIATADNALEPTIINEDTLETFTVEHQFITGDIVRIDTREGHRSLTLIRGGIETNILNSMTRDSKWISLKRGDNLFSYRALIYEEYLNVKISFQPVYTGV